MTDPSLRTRRRYRTDEARLAAWRDGADGFFQWLADVQPMVPSEDGGYEVYQIDDTRIEADIRQALSGDYLTLIFCWPRRHGKTVLVALIIVWRFLTRITQTIGLVANSERQTADTCFRLVRTILHQTAFSRALIESGAVVIGADRIEYEAAENVIQGFTSSLAGLYGKKLTIAQVGELHAAKSDEIFQTLSSSVIDSADGVVLVDSTVGARNSPLYALHQLWERQGDPKLFVSYIYYRDLEHAIAAGPRWIAPDKLRSRAAQMLPAAFAQQHLNQWGSATNALFPAELVSKCKDKYPLDVKTLADGGVSVAGGGLDRAYGFSLHGDATVTTCVLKVLRGEDEHYFVMASDQIRFSSANGIKRALTRYHRDHGMTRAAIESYNSQDIAAWCSEQTFEHETIHATAERQANSFTALYNAAAEGRLHVHECFAKLIAEMATFEYRLEGTGSVQGVLPRFSAPKGAHDDHVYSLAWAMYALRDQELNPYQVNGIHCAERSPVVRLCALNGGKLVPPCSETCKSFIEVNRLYERYKSRAGVAPMAFEDFFEIKVTNIGSHTVSR